MSRATLADLQREARLSENGLREDGNPAADLIDKLLEVIAMQEETLRQITHILERTYESYRA